MTKQLIDDTLVYVRRELTRLSEDLTWADGAEAERLSTRRSRLLAERDRLEYLRQSAAPMPADARDT
jgi:hypothetical protein